MDNSYDLVGEIPTALLLGWQRRPQGRDWTSIPEAGLNAGQYQLPANDTASKDWQVDEQEDNQTLVRANHSKGSYGV